MFPCYVWLTVGESRVLKSPTHITIGLYIQLGLFSGIRCTDVECMFTIVPVIKMKWPCLCLVTAFSPESNVSGLSRAVPARFFYLLVMMC